jgi:hypothetical protein
MSNTNTGGPAFPGFDYIDQHGKKNPEGMTLLDYFAGQALASVNLGIGVTDDFYSRTAKHCYALADALLREKEKHGNS